jgi:hypothetical protein
VQVIQSRSDPSEEELADEHQHEGENHPDTNANQHEALSPGR